jgi:hypothetical protein
LHSIYRESKHQHQDCNPPDAERSPTLARLYHIIFYPHSRRRALQHHRLPHRQAPGDLEPGPVRDLAHAAADPAGLGAALGKLLKDELEREQQEEGADAAVLLQQVEVDAAADLARDAVAAGGLARQLQPRVRAPDARLRRWRLGRAEREALQVAADPPEQQEDAVGQGDLVGAVELGEAVLDREGALSARVQLRTGARIAALPARAPRIELLEVVVHFRQKLPCSRLVCILRQSFEPELVLHEAWDVGKDVLDQVVEELGAEALDPRYRLPFGTLEKAALPLHDRVEHDPDAVAPEQDPLGRGLEPVDAAHLDQFGYAAGVLDPSERGLERDKLWHNVSDC